MFVSNVIIVKKGCTRDTTLVTGCVSAGTGPHHPGTTGTDCDPRMANYTDAQGVQAHSFHYNQNQGKHRV